MLKMCQAPLKTFYACPLYFMNIYILRVCVDTLKPTTIYRVQRENDARLDRWVFRVFKASSSTVVCSFVHIFWLAGIIVEDALEDIKPLFFKQSIIRL